MSNIHTHFELIYTFSFLKQYFQSLLIFKSILMAYLGETKLPFNHRQKVSNGTLEIVQIEKGTDESAYTCQVKNARGKKAQSTFYVNVIGKLVFLERSKD